MGVWKKGICTIGQLYNRIHKKLTRINRLFVQQTFQKRIIEQPDSWKTDTCTTGHLWPFVQSDIIRFYKCPSVQTSVFSSIMYWCPVVQLSGCSCARPLYKWPLYNWPLEQHYSDVIMSAWWASQMVSLMLFTQPFIQAQIKENIKALRHWPLWGEFTGDRWNPTQRASNAENVSIWWRHNRFDFLRSWITTFCGETFSSATKGHFSCQADNFCSVFYELSNPVISLYYHLFICHSWCDIWIMYLVVNGITLFSFKTKYITPIFQETCTTGMYFVNTRNMLCAEVSSFNPAFVLVIFSSWNGHW